MKIVFIGSVIFSKKALEKLISIQADVVGIVTKEKSDFNTIASIALNLLKLLFLFSFNLKTSITYTPINFNLLPI